MNRLEGKVALVTGGAQGLGAAHAQAFVAEGARVVLADVNDAAGKEVASAIGDAVAYVHLDVTDPVGWADALAFITDTYAAPDILINNAAICPVSPIVDMDPAAFLDVLKIIPFGMFLGIRAVAPAMPRGGVIINIGSLDAMRATAGLSAYISAKYAVRGLTKTAALELAPAGIRVLCIHPGAMETPMMHSSGNQLMTMAGVEPDQVDIEAVLKTTIPVGRVAQPLEIAGWSVFLASEAGGYATGSEILVDGGLSLGSSSA